MGKKKIRKTYSSKGNGSSISRNVIKMVKRETSLFDKAFNKIEAWKKGLNPWITVPNPLHETNKRFVKVRANIVYGDPKGRRLWDEE